jgi:hypothetical protein
MFLLCISLPPSGPYAGLFQTRYSRRPSWQTQYIPTVHAKPDSNFELGYSLSWIKLFFYFLIPGVAYWLRHCATNRTVSGSIPGGATLGIFSVATDGTMRPGVDSASKNEYQGIPLGVKAAVAWGWRPTTLVVPNVRKIGGPNLPGTSLGPCGLLWAWPLSLPSRQTRRQLLLRSLNYYLPWCMVIDVSYWERH